MTELKYNHQVAIIDINKIKPNPYNPNIMDEKLFEETKNNIKKEGLVGAIIVRKEKDEYIIIDGEHRWKAAKKLEYKEIPTIILDKNLPEAMISTINFNKLRGEFDTLKLAEVVHELNKTYTIEELEKELGYTQDELQGLENLLKFDFSQFEKESLELDKEDIAEYRFEVVLTDEQYETLKATLKMVNKKNNAEKINDICLKYIKDNYEKNNT